MAEPVYGVPIPPGQPVVGDRVDALRSAMRALESSEVHRFQSMLDNAVERSRRSLSKAADEACHRVAGAVDDSIREQLPRSLRAHMKESAAVSDAVSAVTRDLEQQVHAAAQDTVSRVARDAAVTRDIERHCVARLEGRYRVLVTWAAVGPVVSAALAVCAARWWPAGR